MRIKQCVAHTTSHHHGHDARHTRNLVESDSLAGDESVRDAIIHELKKRVKVGHVEIIMTGGCWPVKLKFIHRIRCLNRR